jgi:hypothetical protein
MDELLPPELASSLVVRKAIRVTTAAILIAAVNPRAAIVVIVVIVVTVTVEINLHSLPVRLG